MGVGVMGYVGAEGWGPKGREGGELENEREEVVGGGERGVEAV